MNLKYLFNKTYRQLVRQLARRRSPLLSFYLKYFWQPKPNSIPHIIEKFAQENAATHFSFLQIGANNGYQNDPMFKLLQRNPHWKGILVEPQKEVFQQQLQVMYAHYKNLSLINAALAPDTGHKPLYKINISTERWATGLASFDRKTLEKHLQNGYIAQQARKQGITMPSNEQECIATEEVSCVSFEYIFENFNINTLHLLLIDTEGFDFEIIKMFDFEKHKPPLLILEFIHLSAADKIACHAFLKNKGYKCHEIQRDLVAVLNL